MDSKDADPLVKELFMTRKEFMDALVSTDFYIELLYINMALAMAVLVSLLVRHRAAAHLEKHPPKRFSKEQVMRPLALLSPFLALIYLSIFKPFVSMYDDKWIDAVGQLCAAFLLVRCVRLLVQSRPMGIFIGAIIMVIALLDVTGLMSFTTAYLEAMSFQIGKFKLSILNLVHGIVMLIIVFWMAGISSNTLESYLRRSSRMSYSARELIVKFFRVFVYFTAIIITLSATGVDLTAFAVFGGALGVGIGLGLQKITSNFVSGIMLLMEKSVKIGDLIEVGNATGWVRQLNIRYTLIETPDGRELLVPNEELVSNRFTNWTYSNDQARVEIKVTVTYDTDPMLARALMLEAAAAHSLCLNKPEPTCWMREFGDNGISFLLTFWISNVHNGRNGPQSEVMFAIYDKFRTNGIEFSMPRQLVIQPEEQQGATA